MSKNIIIFPMVQGRRAASISMRRERMFTSYSVPVVWAPTRSSTHPSKVAFSMTPALVPLQDGGHFKVGWLRTFYNFASMTTGLGIAANIIDAMPRSFDSMSRTTVSS